MRKFHSKVGSDTPNHLHKEPLRSDINKIKKRKPQHIDKYALQNLTRFKEKVEKIPHYKSKTIQYLKKTKEGRIEIKKLTPDQLKIVEDLLGVRF